MIARHCHCGYKFLSRGQIVQLALEVNNISEYHCSRTAMVYSLALKQCYCFVNWPQMSAVNG